MRTRFLCFLSGICFVLTGVPADAENPSREKCTCDLQAGLEPDNGAWVQNATSCWSTEIAERQWCDIVVQSLESGAGQTSVIFDELEHQSDPVVLVATIEDRFKQFASTAEANGSLLDLRRAVTEVPKMLAANADIIKQCLNAAAAGKRGSREKGIDGLQCSVGESSGWLRIEFPLEEAILVYLVASSR